MILRNRLLIIGNVLIWSLFILSDFVLPRFFNLNIPLLGYFPFVIFFFFPFFNLSRRGKSGNTPASRQGTTQQSDDHATNGMDGNFDTGKEKGISYENFGLSEPERRISWQLIAFILIVVLGIAVLLGRFLL
ncbi:MAG: hypothetical protein ACYCT2_03730 [Thermoplasmataceae archaeon]